MRTKKTRQVKIQPDAWTWPSMTIGFCFGRDWLREYHESLRPFLKQREANPTQSRITFASQLKIAPRSPMIDVFLIQSDNHIVQNGIPPVS